MKEQILQSQIENGRLTDSEEFPKVVLIDTVSFCNLACSMCVHPEMKREKGVMSWDLVKKIIDEVAENDRNVRVWMVFFGEPLILKNRKPSIFDMIRYAKDRGLTDVVTNTNANLMDKEASRKLIEAGLDAIYIGVDAFSAETYAKIRVKGNYETTVKNIQNLLRLKEELKTDKPDVFVQFVEMDNNAHEKEAFISFWSEQGAKVKIRPKVSWAGLIEAPNLVLGEEDRWPCYWAMQTMSITNTGKVVTCAVDLDARYIAGDINQSSLKEVWTGALRELRKMHFEKRFADLPVVCRNCKDWQSARADYYQTVQSK
jgi:radical SAM protein with 4Fe4S-binding SPASM domain